MTRIGWFHCIAGASGDMLLGALIDAGAPVADIQAAVDAIGVEPATLRVEQVERQGLAATKVTVDVERSTVVRTWAHVRGLLEGAALPEPVRATALDVFARLANAEATAHRTSPESVHFHEVGGLDAVADIVGSAMGLHLLGIDEVHSSPVATGMGMVRSEHGLLPVPTPAVLSLLEGAPLYSGGVPHELCTPTGAAVLASTVRTWGGLPPVLVERVGTGAGDRDLDDLPNVLRLVVGTAIATTGGAPAVVIEANVDDLDPRVWPEVISRLLAAGAADAWLVPVHMKKGRPAVQVAALADAAVLPAVRDVLFRETSTIGVREHAVTKHALARELALVTLADGSEVAVKVSRHGGRIVSATPEFDDVTRAAAASGRPVKEVLAEAAAAAYRLTDDGDM